MIIKICITNSESAVLLDFVSFYCKDLLEYVAVVFTDAKAEGERLSIIYDRN